MGCDISHSAEQIEQKKINEQINTIIAKDKIRLNRIIKLLLLGPGDSGKSTISKQMKIIYLSGFSEDERCQIKKVIQSNILHYVKILVKNANKFGFALTPSNQEQADKILATLDSDSSLDFNPQIGEIIAKLYDDEAIKSCLLRYSEFQLSDSAPYWFSEIKRISQLDYIPTEADLLRVRIKTTGISEIEFPIGNNQIKMVDVGGQRNERKKWIHCFQDVAAIIYVVSLSEYDIFLEENESINRMHESLKLFEDIVNNAWFSNSAVILLLNKKDLFLEKITRVPLTKCFPHYDGPQTFEAGTMFIESEFKKHNKNSKRAIYTHVSCATDTENVRIVFNAWKDIFLNNLIDNELF